MKRPKRLSDREVDAWTGFLRCVAYGLSATIVFLIIYKLFL